MYICVLHMRGGPETLHASAKSLCSRQPGKLHLVHGAQTSCPCKCRPTMLLSDCSYIRTHCNASYWHGTRPGLAYAVANACSELVMHLFSSARQSANHRSHRLRLNLGCKPGITDMPAVDTIVRMWPKSMRSDTTCELPPAPTTSPILL